MNVRVCLSLVSTIPVGPETKVISPSNWDGGDFLKSDLKNSIAFLSDGSCWLRDLRQSSHQRAITFGGTDTGSIWTLRARLSKPLSVCRFAASCSMTD